MLRDPIQNLAAKLVIVVEGELVVRPAFAGQKLVGASLPLDPPANSLQSRSTRRALVAGQLLTQNLKRDVKGRRR